MEVALSIYVLATLQQVLEVATLLLALLILASSLDDFFVDVCYWAKIRAGKGGRLQPRSQLTLARLLAEPERKIAVIVPAWQEHQVIRSMLETNTEHICYESYDVFVGIYGNDRETLAEVERAKSAMLGHIHVVPVPRDGPTSKADCINVLVDGVYAHELLTGEEYHCVVLHDAEDVVHPFELKLFNHLLGQGNDFVQLPIFSLDRPITDLVSGTYMDDFAEWHSKDLVVRQSLTGTVPCAGTAACFSRKALNLLAGEAGETGGIFRPASLTEDYDVSFRLSRYGVRQLFALVPFDLMLDVRAKSGVVLVRKRLPLAAREYFPSNFRAAYRQRARWLLGIAYQGWLHHGWQGSFLSRYFLARDRKALIAAPMAVLAYFVMVAILIVSAAFNAVPQELRMDYVILNKPWFHILITANLIFLANRCIHRIYFTTRIYGIGHGLMTVPRIVVANFINLFAVLRAGQVLARHKRTGAPIGWDKTGHQFPRIAS